MATIQVPPAVGSSGQFLDAIVITSSTNRQVVVVGDPTSTANLLGINASGQMTVVQAATVRSLSSGTITFSSAPTVNVSSGTFTLSSTPLILSASSGLVQTLTSGPMTISGTVTVVNTSSGLVQTLTSGPATISGTVTVLSASSGLVQTLTSGPATISGTVTVLSASSGLVQISGTPTVVSASSGLIQTLTSGATVISSASGTQVVTITGTSSGPVVATSSGGLSVNITNITGPVTTSWGVVVQQTTGQGGGVTSTYLVLSTVQAITTVAGRLLGFNAYATAVTAAGTNPVLRFYNATTANVVIGTSQMMAFLIQVDTTGALSGVDMLVNPPVWFGPNGVNFGTAMSVDAGVTATGTVYPSSVYLTAFYV